MRSRERQRRDSSSRVMAAAGGLGVWEWGSRGASRGGGGVTGKWGFFLVGRGGGDPFGRGHPFCSRAGALAVGSRLNVGAWEGRCFDFIGLGGETCGLFLIGLLKQRGTGMTL